MMSAMETSDDQSTDALVADIEDIEEVTLRFALGLPGFPDSRNFVVRELGPRFAPFAQMRSLDTPEIAFTVVPPGTLFPDYRVVIDDEHVARLDLDSAEDAVVLCIVTPAPPPGQAKVNLLGPIVVNRRTHEAAQVIQHGSDYGVAVPIGGPTSSPGNGRSRAAKPGQQG
jgi:flagellar assembly factor FliW